MSDKVSPTLTQRLQFAFYSVSLAATVFVIVVLLGGQFLENGQRLATNSIYVATSSWDIPAFIAIPTFISLIVILVQKLLDKERESTTQRALKIAIFFAIGAIVVRVPYGFVLSSHMHKQGYTPCLQYSSAALLSPTVWVREQGYCVANAGSVRRQVLQWIDETEKPPTPSEVNTKVQQLLATYDRKEREKYPELYD